MDDEKRKLLRIDTECHYMTLIKATQYFIPVVQFCFGDVTQKCGLVQGSVFEKVGKRSYNQTQRSMDGFEHNGQDQNLKNFVHFPQLIQRPQKAQKVIRPNEIRRNL